MLQLIKSETKKPKATTKTGLNCNNIGYLRL